MNVAVDRATAADAGAIARVIRANRADSSLFQQTRSQIESAIGDFLVARCGDAIAGCVAIRDHGGSAKILAVAVSPEVQGRGVGGALLAAAVDRARAVAPLVWLGTAKPGYFARHGFAPISRWRLPIRLLVRKLFLVFRQPIRRWLPAIFGRHVFMALPPGDR